MAIPNGGLRSKTQGAKLKAEGVVAGVPDLFLAYPIGDCAGLWIEMKNGKKGRLSDAQESIHQQLRFYGYSVEVIRTFEDFEKAINDYINGTE